MKYAKAILCIFLLVVLVGSYVPAMDVEASSTPVWRVAWVIVPETIMTINGDLRHTVINENDGLWSWFMNSAAYFESFVQTHTNNAVDVQISIIEIGEPVHFPVNKRPTCPVVNSFNVRLTCELIEKYGLYNYDTWMVGWAFFRSGGWAYDSRESFIGLNTSVSSTIYDSYMVFVHEFLHNMEFWFRDRLGFPLPYDVDGSRALHYPLYYGFVLWQPGLTLDELRQLGRTWYAAWFSQSVPNPGYPGNGLPQYLGIPAEAWNYRPTSEITVTFQPNNGLPPTVDAGRAGRVIERPNPEATALTDGMVFRGWYHDAEFTRRVMFPYTTYLRRGGLNRTFHARWAERGAAAIVPSNDPLAYIDLTNERLVLPYGFHVEAYSTNGGRTWRMSGRGNIDRFYRMLNRELQLAVADSWDSAARRPADGANIIAFETVQRRPRANAERLAVFYHTDTWSLLTRVSRQSPTPATPTSLYEFVHSTTGRLPAVPEWIRMDSDFDVISRPPRGDRTQNVFFFRSAPIADAANGVFVPASRTFRVRPRPFGNAPRLSIHAATQTIRVRRGQEYSVNNGLTWTPVALDSRNRPLPLDAVRLSETGATEVRIRMAATGRSVRSEVQRLTLPAIAIP